MGFLLVTAGQPPMLQIHAESTETVAYYCTSSRRPPLNCRKKEGKEGREEGQERKGQEKKGKEKEKRRKGKKGREEKGRETGN